METELLEKSNLVVPWEFVVAPEVAAAPEIAPAIRFRKPKRRAAPRLCISQSTVILAIAKMQGWEEVRKVGQGGMIDGPIETNGWKVISLEMYKGIIPPEAMHKVETLTRGIRLKGLLVADDMQHIEQQSRTMPLVAPAVSPDWEKIGAGLGKVALVAAIGMAVIAVLPLVLGVAGVAAALAYDPLIIGVTQENEWIELCEWWHQ